MSSETCPHESGGILFGGGGGFWVDSEASGCCVWDGMGYGQGGRKRMCRGIDHFIIQRELYELHSFP